MRKEWTLPEEKEFWYTGSDWLQVLLDRYDTEMRRKILLLLWRAWFLRDDCVHNAGKESVSRSVIFLVQYEEEIKNLSLSNDGHKGKSCWTLSTTRPSNPGNLSEDGASAQWKLPPSEVVKLNTDAAYLAETGQAWAGGVARDHRGLVLFSTSTQMRTCGSVEEAEGHAILTGLVALSGLYL